MKVSCEQQARDILERMEVPNAQDYRPSELVEIANLIDDKSLLSCEDKLKDSALQAADYLCSEVEDNWEREGYISVDTINAAKAFRKACLALVSEGQWRGEQPDQPGSCYYCGKHRSLHREGKLPECRQNARV